MNLRSRGPTNLIDRVDDIRQLERAHRKARREQERLAQEEQVEMADNRNMPNDHDDDEPRAEGRNPQVHPQRPRQNIGAYDEPHTHGHRTGIQPPPVDNHNFEIKASLINMVQGSKFHGLPMEDPLDHLDQFDRFCGTTKMNGVSEDALKLRLFPFSLGEKAHTWEKNLPPDSITTWDQCKKAFLGKFFSATRTNRLRNEISSFTQRGNESFSEAWERFKGLTSQCPHHGFTHGSLLGTLYRGVSPKYRAHLDIASRGNFLGQEAEDGLNLVESLATSDSNYGGEDYDRSSRDGSEANERHRREMKALNEKMDKLLQVSQKQVHFVGDNEGSQGYQDAGNENYADAQAEMNYIGGQGQGFNKGFNPNYRNHPNFSYRNTNVENPQDQIYPALKHQGNNQQGFQPRPQFSNQPPPQNNEINATLERILEGQIKGHEDIRKQFVEIHAKVDGMYNDLDGKYNSLASHIKTIDLKVAQVASSSTNPSGVLPSKPQPNPKGFCNAILTNDANEHEREVEEISRLVYGVSEVDLASQGEAQVQVRARVKEKAPEVEKKDNADFEVSPYVPPLPFPQRFYTKAQKKVLSSFKACMNEIGVPLPSLDNLYQVPTHKKFIQAILDNRPKVEEVMRLYEPPSAAPLEPKTLTKLDNPGIFIISCSLGDLTVDDALCDSGATVNVMSIEMMKSIGVKDMKNYSSTIMYADASSKSPLGVIEDYPLMVGDCLVPTDFLVIEREQPDKLPLILGTPFLNTAGASIDFSTKRVTLHHVNSKVSYPMKFSSTALCGTITNEKSERKEELKVVNKKNLETLGFDEETLDGECLHSLFDEDEENGTETRLVRTDKVLEKKKKKKKMKDTHPPNLSPSPLVSASMTLHPRRCVDGEIEYKVKCQGMSNQFSRVKAILTPELSGNDSPVLKGLMKEALIINIKGGTSSTNALYTNPTGKRSFTTPHISPLPKVPD